LIRRRLCPREVLHYVAKVHRQPGDDADTNIKLIDVTICHLRKRFGDTRKPKKPPMFVIDTVWSVGYSMSEEYRKKAAGMLLEYLELDESHLSKIVSE
jgi:hypothetical protein